MNDAQARPNKPLALLLGAICGFGVGHFYAGLRRRALVWVLGANAFVLAGACLVVLLGRTRSFGTAFALLLGIALVAWAAPLADLAVLPKERFVRSSVLGLVGFIALAVVLGIGVRLVVRGVVLEAFRIPSSSMAPAVLVGDHVFVDKLRYRSGPPARGEIAVFPSPEHPEQDFLKRIVGLPGDRIEMRGGHLWLNEHEVPHCSVGSVTLPPEAGRPGPSGVLELERLDAHDYLVFHDASAPSAPADAGGPWPVQPGEVFVLGDNRENAADSRSFFGGKGGGVPIASLKGRAIGVWLRLTADAVDWSRVGVPLTEPALPSSAASLAPALAACEKKLAGE